MNWCAGVLLVFWMQKEHTWSRVKWLRKAWNDGHFLLGLRNQVCTCIRDGYTGKSKGMRQRVGGKGWLPISVWSTVARPARTWGLCREQEVLALHPETEASSRAELCLPTEKKQISVWGKNVTRMLSSQQSSMTSGELLKLYQCQVSSPNLKIFSLIGQEWVGCQSLFLRLF